MLGLPPTARRRLPGGARLGNKVEAKRGEDAGGPFTASIHVRGPGTGLECGDAPAMAASGHHVESAAPEAGNHRSAAAPTTRERGVARRRHRGRVPRLNGAAKPLPRGGQYPAGQAGVLVPSPSPWGLARGSRGRQRGQALRARRTDTRR
ncbi:hypothetical protein CDD83_2620 [Cordyceps sp. RAO-2017]|nr:hypothetical protein CDD83_2620 [Cordyceps sp. RAO-2017]